MCMDMPNQIGNDRVAYMVENRKKLEAERHQFGIKHGFVGKRSQYFKDCLVIRWKHRTRKDKNFIDYDRINEWAELCNEISEKYNLYDDKNPLLESELKLLKVGIYVFRSFSLTWAIPNEFKEIQEYVLSKVPAWAIVSKK